MLFRSWHRSHAEHPAPLGFGPSSPPPQLHAGTSSPSTPGTWNPPPHAAMDGYFSRSRNPSRSPSAHPTFASVVVVVVELDVDVEVEVEPEVVVEVVDELVVEALPPCPSDS